MNVILWFKRDLRIADHPALALAASRGGAVLPLYIVEPELWAQQDASERQWDFVCDCLRGLDSDLRALGAPLVIRTGDAVDVLDDLRKEFAISALVSHQETGNAWTFARDKRVAAWARGQGVTWHETPQSGVVRRLGSRDGWQRLRDEFVRDGLVEPPSALKGINAPSDPFPNLSFDSPPCPERQPGGRKAALTTLESFLSERGKTYRSAMSSPLQGADACSRLSPHLSWGTLSVREAAQAGATRKEEARGTRDGWLGSMRSFEARLAWRDHFTQKLEDAPDLESRCLHSAYENLRPRTPDRARLEAWEAGETGIPFVDACMRFLVHTGWLNFRMRAMLMSVASYHLWLDWRSSAPHLARMFTDYEPGIHWSQVQMQSGVTGMNSIRIYNPVKQGKEQDPDGIFTRRWVPELATVPEPFLQEPWRWEGSAALKYPAPIVEPAAAARAARDAIWAVRKSPEAREEAQQVNARHGSRKNRSQRRKRARAKSSNQMSFDF